MKIGIIGTGQMASGLGTAWARAGHEVIFGSRDAGRTAALADSAGRNARGGLSAEAAESGEAVLLAVRWQAVDDVLRATGPLDGKILLDCTNPLTPDFLTLVVGHTDSGAERIAARVPGARVVKPFNHVYAPLIHAGPRFGDRNATVPYCGDDAGAKQVAAELESRFTARSPEPRRSSMASTTKQPATLSMPWEEQYGYAQAVKVEDTGYVAGQVSHDDAGNIVGIGDMEGQMRQAYANIARVLTQYGATLADVVDEMLFVTDMDAAFQAAVNCRREVFSGRPVVASTILQIQRLAFPEFMIEIRCIAVV